MPPDDPLPTLATADLAQVTGGGSNAMSSMLPMMIMMMMRNRAQAQATAVPIATPAESPDPTAAWRPRIFVDGVEQQPATTANGLSYTTTTPL